MGGASEGAQTDMDLQDLATRLNIKEYKNWIKAWQCLTFLRDGLSPFIAHRMKGFHGDLLRRKPLLRRPCNASCRPKGTKFSPCGPCSEWRMVILEHHRQRDSVPVNWGNCFPSNWRTNYWELAKAYMPRGQAGVTEADRCDASALLNLINFCDCFQTVNLTRVRGVIHYRNDLAHVPDPRVSDEWMGQYQNALNKLVQELHHVPQMAAAGRQIEEMQTLDLSIYICANRMDSSELDDLEQDSVSQWELTGDLISQWEAEVLQERLRELLHAAAADSNDGAKAQDMEQLKRLGGFLQASTDLAERFSAELQAIVSLEARG